MCDADQSQQHDSEPAEVIGPLGLPDKRANSWELTKRKMKAWLAISSLLECPRGQGIRMRRQCQRWGPT